LPDRRLPNVAFFISGKHRAMPSRPLNREYRSLL
jgi:hypothetical protein